MLLRNDYIQNKNWEIDFHQVMNTKNYRKSVKQARRWEKSYNLLWVTVSGKLMRLNCKELEGESKEVWNWKRNWGVKTIL